MRLPSAIWALTAGIVGLSATATGLDFFQESRDFEVYFAAAHRLFNGAVVHRAEPNAFTYPTFAALLYSPLYFPGFETGRVLLFISMLGASALGCWLFARALVPPAVPSWIVCLSLLLSLRPFMSAFGNQQSDCFVFLCIAIAALGITQRKWSGPTALGFAVAIKANPLFLILVPGFRGRWRDCVFMLGVAVSLVLLPDLLRLGGVIAGGDSFVATGSPVTHASTTLSVNANIDVTADGARTNDAGPLAFDHERANDSTLGYLREHISLTARSQDEDSWWSQPANHLNQALTRISQHYWSIWNPSGGPTTAVFFIFWCVVFAVVLRLLSTRQTIRIEELLILAYGAFVLIGPVSSKPHFVAVFPLLLILFLEIHRRKSKLLLALALAGCFGVSLTGGTVVKHIYRSNPEELGQAGTVGVSFAALWVLTALLLWTRKYVKHES